MSKKEIKAERVAEFLLDSGLLFEINRVVLHPRGLALSVAEHEDGTVFGPLWDCRDGGIKFSAENYEEGREKLRLYEAKYGKPDKLPQEEP